MKRAEYSVRQLAVEVPIAVPSKDCEARKLRLIWRPEEGSSRPSEWGSEGLINCGPMKTKT